MKKFNSPGDIHFVTTRTFNKKKFFEDERCCLILLEELDFYRRKYCYEVYGYVIMSDHFHCLLFCENEKITISKIIQNIKSSSARRIINYYKSMGSREHLLSARIDNTNMEQVLHATRERIGHKRGLKYRIWQPGFYDFNISFF